MGDRVQIRFVNYYRCPDDGATWVDAWDSMCNDHCPVCDAEIEPYKSVEVDES